MKTPTLKQTWEEQDKKFMENYCRKDKSTENLGFMIKWFIRDDITFKALRNDITQDREATLKWVLGEIEDWKTGNCTHCGDTVPNWNCKGHAYVDLKTSITNVLKK